MKPKVIYFVSENRKSTRLGGKGICQVFVLNSWSFGELRPIDATDTIAERFGFTVKKGSIEIGYGSGTGFMRIEQAILKDEPRAKVYNLSVFNQ